jgi:photosystem II stability/assembly factor-like uncharacterized protein
MGKHGNRTLVLAAILVFYSLSCVSHGHNRTPPNSRPEEVITVLRPVPAVLNEETHPPVEASETNIKGKAGERFDFKRAQFVDESHGWAMTESELYRTTNAGKNWERLPQAPEKDARFTSFFFVDELHGWLTAVRSLSVERWGLGKSSVIMVTDDGGSSWKLQASFPNEINIEEIRFFNSNEGFAVGRRMIDSEVVYEELLVLSTSNGGKDWNDTSEAAKAVVKDQYGRSNDSGKHIQWTSSSSALLLTRYGRVVSTTDGGKTWKLIATFKAVRPHGLISPTAMHKLALDPQQRVRVVAGGIGDENYKGYWGEFVAEEDGGWSNHEIDRTPIVDAVFLSENEVLACGQNRRRGDEKPNPRLKDAGVILRSFDSGKSWQSIYRSKSYETFFFLTKVKDHEFYAVSDTGTFLRFTLPQ